MFSHVMVGSNDIERSSKFYDALFGKEAMRDNRGRLVYRNKGFDLMHAGESIRAVVVY